MKVCILGDITQANMERFLADAFVELGCEAKTIQTGKDLKLLYNKKLSGYLLGALFIKNYYDNRYLNKLNKDTYQKLIAEKPDLIISHNNAKLSTDTLRRIRNELRIPIVCLAADDPTIAYGNYNYLESILGFTHIVAVDSSMIKRIKYFAETPVYYYPGATNKNIYRVLENIPQNKVEEYQSKISYCSAAYSGNAMGVYRGAILSHLSEMGLKIYGDTKWSRVAEHFPEIKKNLYTKGFVSAEELNIIYNLSDIFVTIGNPILLDGISQRVFDCAAAKCFQITEWKKDLYSCFSEDEIVSFKCIPELKEKVKWFLDNPAERKKIAERAYKKVVNNYQFTHLAKKILEIVNK